MEDGELDRLLQLEGTATALAEDGCYWGQVFDL